MKKTNLTIGTYYLAPYAGSKKHVKELAECGIDMVVNMRRDKQVLDLLHQYNVGAVLTGVFPGWFGGDGSNAGTMSQMNPLEQYEVVNEELTEHPAVWGIDVGDEPSACDFLHYGEIFRCVEKKYQNKFAYLNLYPSYGVKGTNMADEIQAQLGTADYAEYIEQFCTKVQSKYICFDYYLYSADISGLWKSLIVVSDACKKYGREMWMVLQVNSHIPDVWISTNQLRFQAYAALAFGAEVIIWACYTAGWWYNHVLDKNGNKTQQYDKLKKVNEELHLLGMDYMNYQPESTWFVGTFSEQEPDAAGKTAVDALNTRYFKNLKAENGQRLLVGVRKREKETRTGILVQEALMICAADDPFDKKTSVNRVTFYSSNKNLKAVGRNGLIKLDESADGMISFEIHSCEGVLLMGL